MERVLVEMVQKTMYLHVLFNLEFVAITFTNFDLSMSKGGINMFALIINYLDDGWILRHATIGLFEVHEATNVTMALQLIHHVIAFVKDEGINLGTMVVALRSIINYDPLKLSQVYEGACFGHVMFKMCQCVTNDDKVVVGLILVNVKDVQTYLQKTITWIKKSGKRRKEGEHACINNGL